MGRRVVRGCVFVCVLVLVGVFGGAAAGASNGIGPVQQASDSTADNSGSVYVSDGTTPMQGGMAGDFTKGDEADSSGNMTTSMVNIEFPVGVTLTPSSECSIPGEFGYCISLFPPFEGPACSAPTGLTVDGNVVSVAIACAPGETFVWDLRVDSLITTTGFYETDVVFKVGSVRRTADNMYAIRNVGPLHVDPLPS